LNKDLNDCDMIMGVKEVPLDQLLPNKSYIFFSHTHKGQRRNLPLLNQICANGITLHDYELIKKDGKRLVAFGRFAGYAGMINALNGLGNVLLARGIRSPFIPVPLAHHFRNIDHAKRSIIELGNEIKSKGISKEINPIVFTFTGKGNVSQGAQEIFKLLPHEWIEAKDLKELVGLNLKRDRVYGCLIEAKDYIKRKSSSDPFDYEEYFSNPELFESHFHKTIAPFSTAIINGIYWEPQYPRLLTKEQMKEIQLNEQSRLLTIADISCDIEGSIEFMDKASTIDEPFYYYDAIKDSYNINGDGIQIMSIDNLPTELPEDSSKYFGNQLVQLIPSLVTIIVICKSNLLVIIFVSRLV
jgi:alpha-aminoadipic semialdehyde synthase